MPCPGWTGNNIPQLNQSTYIKRGEYRLFTAVNDMVEIAHRRPLAIKRKYVYWIVQLMFVIALIGFLYSYLTNKGISLLTNVTGSVTGEPVFEKFIYGKFGGGEFDKPMAVTVTGDKIYISDTNNKRVQIFDYAGNPLKTFGSWGNGPGQFQFPYGLAVDSKGVVYVADLYNGSISKFDGNGKYLGLFAEQKASDNILTSPAGLAIKDDRVYVTDVKQDTLKIFDLNGMLVKQIGKPGTGDGQLNAPNAVTVDNGGNIYVTDTGNQRVEVFDKNGRFLKVINGSLDGRGQSVFVNPRGIGVDDKGNIYAVSNLTHRFYVFDKDGKQRFTIGGFGQAEKQFSLPNGLFVDDRGRVYVTDTTNERVAVFRT